MIFADRSGRVSLFKGVVKKNILHATFIHFCFKVYTLVSFFESSTILKC